MINSGRWSALGKVFHFEPRFLCTVSGKPVIDWACVPPSLYLILQKKGEREPSTASYNRVVRREYDLVAIEEPIPSGLNQISIYFDGGGNGQFAYGSWEALYNGFKKRVYRQSFADFRTEDGKSATSNCAEFLSLISALEWVQSVQNKDQYVLRIYGDSALVINQIKGAWRCRCEHLASLRDRAVKLMNGFKYKHCHWHPRRKSVAIFGH